MHNYRLGLVALPVQAANLSGFAQVINGDTIEVEDIPIRLWGIDASEMK